MHGGGMDGSIKAPTGESICEFRNSLVRARIAGPDLLKNNRNSKSS
jgi:hypothetical protein